MCSGHSRPKPLCTSQEPFTKNNKGTHSETKSSLDPPENVVEQLNFVLSHPQHQIMVCVHDKKGKYIGVTAT